MSALPLPPNFELPLSLSLSLLFSSPRLLPLSFVFFFSSGEVTLTSRMLQAPRSIKYAVRAIMTFVYWENHKQSWWMDVKLWTGSFIYLFIWHISARTTWKHEDWYSWVVNSDMHRHACTGFLHRLTQHTNPSIVRKPSIVQFLEAQICTALRFPDSFSTPFVSSKWL